MGKIQDFLGADWIECELRACQGDPSASDGPDAHRGEEVVARAVMEALTGNEEETAWDLKLRRCMKLCELEYAAGRPPAVVRSICR